MLGVEGAILTTHAVGSQARHDSVTFWEFVKIELGINMFLLFQQ